MQLQLLFVTRVSIILCLMIDGQGPRHRHADIVLNLEIGRIQVRRPSRVTQFGIEERARQIWKILLLSVFPGSYGFRKSLRIQFSMNI
jgi:hypothetical protein